MAQVLIHSIRESPLRWRRMTMVEDPLDAIRGILLGALVSMLGFWLPLALALLQ